MVPSKIIQGSTLLTSVTFCALLIAAGPRGQGCYTESSALACAGVPVQAGQCPIEIISDGECYSTMIASHGTTTISAYQVTCTYQKKKKDSAGKCTIDDGVPTNFVRSCTRAVGTACPS